MTALTAKVSLKGQHVLILGAGGASRAIAYGIIQAGGRVSLTDIDAARAAALPGAVLSVEPGGGFIVKCASGALLVKTVKPEGKREMPGADFLNGLRLRPGDRLI